MVHIVQFALVLLYALAALAGTAFAQATFIGALSTLQHNVSGDVFAIDSRTLRIDNLYYDGLGPAGVFWVDVVSRATPDGRIVPFKDSCEASPKLPPYSGDSVVLELPLDLTLSDVRYFSVWCRAVDVEFGGVSVNPSIVSSVPQLDTATCQGGDAAEMSGVFPVRDGWNCEPLNDFYQVRWRLGEDTVDIELVVRLNDGQYAGFGPSGSDSATVMEGSDVAIAHRTENGSFSVVDFHITTRSQCSNGIGVCPDVDLATNAGVDSITNVGGNSAEGVTQFTYTRPLVATDTVDRDIVIEGESFLSWAVGPIADGLPNFHQGPMNFPQPGPDGVKVMIEWGRSPNDACPVFVPSEDGDDDDDSDTGDTSNLPGFVRPTISDVTEITARIGPSGGVRGVAAITGSGNSWGIAWYLSPTGGNDSDILIPAVAVERGKTYTFTVYGGRPDLNAEVHPLYITNSSEGGYDTRTPQERKFERVYAGIEVTDEDAEGVYNYTATAAGALCKLTTDVIDTENFTWPQYSDSLNTSCVQNDTITEAGATLTWTVPEDAEDIVYYQCVTHRFLGFKLVVFDDGRVDLELLEQQSGGATIATLNARELPSVVSEMRQASNCNVAFGDSDLEFASCDLETFAPLELYYALADGEIDTLFRISKQDGMDYLAFGWGYDQMVVGNGSNVMVALAGVNGADPIIQNYLLTEKAPSGVMPEQADVSDAQVDVANDYITGRFKRDLNTAGLPSIETGETPFIWSFGSAGNPPSLMRHTSRGVGQIVLLEAASEPQPTAESEPIATETPEETYMATPVPSTTSAACSVPFRGEMMEFGGCDLESFAPLEVYYSVQDGEIDTLFRAAKEADMDYLAFGWGYNQMVVGNGSNVMVTLTGVDGQNPTIQNYILREKASSGVEPAEANVSDAQAEETDEHIAGRFKRPLDSMGLPSISLTETPFIWSSGSAGDRPSLNEHKRKAVGSIDLRSGDAQPPVQTPTESPPAAGNPDCQVEFRGKTEQFDGCTTLFAPFEVYYSVADGEIDTLFRVRTDTGRQYVGFGWGYNRMVDGGGSNVMVVLTDAQRATSIENYILRDYEVSAVTESESPDKITEASAEVSGDYIAGRFKRQLNTTTLPSISIGTTPFIFAYGSAPAAPSLAEHTNNGVGEINLADGSVSSVNSNIKLFRAHSVLMAVSWAVLAPYAIAIVRLKRFNPISFQVHRALNTAVATATLIGFLLAVVKSTLQGHPHRFIGYVVTGLVILQAIGGYARPKEGKRKIRTLWHFGHGGLGIAAVVLGVVNIFIGIALPYFDSRTVWYVLTAVSVAGAVIIGLLSFLPSLSKSPENSTGKAGREASTLNEGSGEAGSEQYGVTLPM